MARANIHSKTAFNIYYAHHRITKIFYASLNQQHLLLYLKQRTFTNVQLYIGWEMLLSLEQCVLIDIS